MSDRIPPPFFQHTLFPLLGIPFESFYGTFPDVIFPPDFFRRTTTLPSHALLRLADLIALSSVIPFFVMCHFCFLRSPERVPFPALPSLRRFSLLPLDTHPVTILSARLFSAKPQRSGFPSFR